MDPKEMEMILRLIMSMLNGGAISSMDIVKALLEDNFIKDNMPWSRIDLRIILSIAENSTDRETVKLAENELLGRKTGRDEMLEILKMMDGKSPLWKRYAQKVQYESED